LEKKAFAVLLLSLITVTLVLMPLPSVTGQYGVNIYSVTPESGVAGQEVNLQGTINTPNADYQVYLNDRLVASGTSEGYFVNPNFTIPELPEGAYSLVLMDTTLNVNATSQLSVLIAYYIKAVEPAPPAQLQEGDDVVLNVTLTGGQLGATYQANVTIELPDPLKTAYSQTVTLLASAQTGTAHAEITFPSTAFQPSGSLTNYVGSYSLYFNQTQGLASTPFFVGFTDANQYHRGEIVTIRAIGYQANQSSTVIIKNQNTSETVYSESVTATNEGIINTAWTVPNNAQIGTYQVTITPVGTQKPIADSQTFTLPGYPTTFHTLNLARENVPQIVVDAFDEATDKTYSATSGDDGVAIVNLEKGTHNVVAYWNDVKIGETTISVTGESVHDITCELTNLEITVKDRSGLPIPFVALGITYSYNTTKGGSSRTGSATGQTGTSGTFLLNSTLPGITYKISASVYDVIFNGDSDTFSDVAAVPTNQIMILLPSRNLTLKILDFNQQPIPAARIALAEQKSGIFYAASSDEIGNASVDVALGKYQVRVYASNILLNETVIEVFSDEQTEIRCILYNLQVSVSVVDYFGQPIPGVNVVFRGPDEIAKSKTTESNGIATFNNVIGGDSQIIAYLSGRENFFEAVKLQVTSPTAVQVKMGKYVLLGAFVIETSLFVTLIIVSAVAVLFLSLEVYRRRKLKPAKPETSSGNASK
jgi:hypothetical protein